MGFGLPNLFTYTTYLLGEFDSLRGQLTSGRKDQSSSPDLKHEKLVFNDTVPIASEKIDY